MNEIDLIVSSLRDLTTGITNMRSHTAMLPIGLNDLHCKIRILVSSRIMKISLVLVTECCRFDYLQSFHLPIFVQFVLWLWNS